MSRIFVSHTHTDKPIARRVVRRLNAYGISVWLDEREMRLGTALETTIESHIRDCEIVVAIATNAASQSPWVKRELSFASSLDPPRPICPLLVEPVEKHAMFADHLGLDATDLHSFEIAIAKLARAILEADLPEPNTDQLLAGVEAVTREEPSLLILADACQSGQGLSVSSIDTVMKVPFHPLDFCINALFDCLPAAQRQLVAHHAAISFERRGAGTYTLEKYARTRSEHDHVIGAAVGAELEVGELPSAIRIISSCSEPDDQALASFIWRNSSRLSESHCDAVVRLITHPNREPHGFTVDAAVASTKLVPDSQDLRQLWIRWIVDGKFDGEVASPDAVVGALTEILSLESVNWDDLINAFRGRIRKLARTPDRGKVNDAVNYLTAAAYRHSPLLQVVGTECRAAMGSAEWDGWSDRDEMAVYVSEFVSCAYDDQDWSSAFERYKAGWSNIKRVRSLRAELEK